MRAVLRGWWREIIGAGAKVYRRLPWVARLRELQEQHERQRMTIKSLFADIKARARSEERLTARIAELERSDGLGQLTAAEVERLAILAEECGDVAQIVGKILRNGWGSESRPGGMPNRPALERKLGGLRAITDVMIDAGDLRVPGICSWRDRKRLAISQWSRHQAFSSPAEAERQ